jgi:hypothetical protein
LKETKDLLVRTRRQIEALTARENAEKRALKPQARLRFPSDLPPLAQTASSH